MASAHSNRAALVTVIASLLFVAGLASGCTGLTGAPSVELGTPVAVGTTSPTDTAVTRGASPARSTRSTRTLGPRGYGPLTLGRSYDDALATGLLTGTPGSGWNVKGHSRAEVCLSRAGGLMAIFGDATMPTPEGIRLGSSLADVKAAYPALKRGVDYFYVPLSRTTAYEFLVDTRTRRVHEWNLTTTSETCFN